MPLLEFKGKGFIYAHHLGVEYRNLVVDKKKSMAAAGAKANIDGNLIIHGDNLHALKALMPRYAGRINCIYIDPPYNTGNEGWVYNDRVNSPLMKQWLKENGAVDGEDPERHDKWLCMMWPRLQLLRELLAEDGVIFISIDDNEHHRLRMMMDEIFGEYNFVNTLVWVSNIKGRQIIGAGAANTSEYILVYAKDKEEMAPWNPLRVETATRLMPSAYKMQKPELRQDAKGTYVIKNELHNTNTVFNEETRPNLVFVIHYNPKTYEVQFSETASNEEFPGFVKIAPRKNYDGVHKFHAWRWSKERILTNIEDLHFEKRNDSYQIYTKVRNYETTNLKNLITNITNGNLVLKEFNLNFLNAKPQNLIKLLIQTTTRQNAIILDSFAGSGTTAHAVLALNKEDGGNRKFILVECEEYADTITAERVRRVIKGVPGAKDNDIKNGLDGSFTFCTLGEELNVENMLTGTNLPDYETLAHHLAHVARGITLDRIKQGTDYLYAETQDECFYLIYKPDLAFLSSKESALALPMVERIHKSINKKGKSALVFAPWKFMGQKELTKKRITYCQLPWAIHRMYGDELGKGGT